MFNNMASYAALLLLVSFGFVSFGCTSSVVAPSATAAPAATKAPAATTNRVSFFLTSVGPGNGANLGGLAGADAHCQKLAETADAGDQIWRAYLSTSASGATAAVNARDRIGSGPWHNTAGVIVAADVEQLHGENNLTKETVLTEAGAIVNGRGDSPNRHDILTGSNLDGRASASTCENWTSSGEGSALAGHHDRTGGGANPSSWNSAHGTRGCSQAYLRSSGGEGLFYCFATGQQ